ncbi:hypothetical protein GCM10009801_79940 [Streptomyces albiaxialis]|uniref:DUF2637 domain-containing protein n=1 Tax=Streptomyces albiaxialis TaxID=329523 RepID=A0ABN2X4G6_9ACTN
MHSTVRRIDDGARAHPVPTSGHEKSPSGSVPAAQRGFLSSVGVAPRGIRSGPTAVGERFEVWVERAGALLVAGVGAYASYVHQREFALRGGADPASAALWPLSVDGLLLLATVGLLKRSGRWRAGRGVLWTAFLLGVAVSLTADIAAAPTLGWRPILVAGWPPVALLLAVELLTHRARVEERGASAARESAGEEAVPASDGDPLPAKAWEKDLRHREVPQRPISAESLRRDLHIAAGLDRFLDARGISLLRPSYRNRVPRPGESLLQAVRQLMESVNDTLTGQLDLDAHGGRTIEGVGVRVAQRILAMTCAVWHNRTTGRPITRSLIAYDH